MIPTSYVFGHDSVIDEVATNMAAFSAARCLFRSYSLVQNVDQNTGILIRCSRRMLCSAPSDISKSFIYNVVATLRNWSFTTDLVACAAIITYC
jgi:hypothetical protein